MLLWFSLAAQGARRVPTCAPGALGDDATARFVALAMRYHENRLLTSEDLAAIDSAEHVFNPLTSATAGREIERHAGTEAFRNVIAEGVDLARAKTMLKTYRDGQHAQDETRDRAAEATAWRYHPLPIEREDLALPRPDYIDHLRTHPTPEGGVIYSANTGKGYVVLDPIDGKPSAVASGRRVADTLARPDGKHLFTTIDDDALPPRFAHLNSKSGVVTYLDYADYGYDNEGRREVFAFLDERGRRGLFTAYGANGRRAWTFERTKSFWELPALLGPTTFARSVEGKRIYSATMVVVDGHRELQVHDAITDELLERRPFADEQVKEAGNLIMHVDGAGKRYVVARGPKTTQVYDLDGAGSFSVPTPSFSQGGSVLVLKEMVATEPPFVLKKDGSLVFSYLCGVNKLVLIDFGAKTQSVKTLPYPSAMRDGRYLAVLNDGRVTVTLTTDEGFQLVDFSGGTVFTFPDKKAHRFAGIVTTPDNRVVLVPQRETDSPVQIYGPPQRRRSD